MLIGAHVSTAGGLVKAHGRGLEIGAEAIQVFNQSPRMWKPTRWKQDDVAEFLSLMEDGPIRSIVIHAVYLINAASKDPAIREKSRASLVHSLRMGDEIGADGVVLHPGSTVGEPHEEALERVGETLRFALDESERCPLLLEDTAGAGNTLGRSFEELARLVELAGGGDGGASGARLGICLDSCHLLASGYDVRSADGVSAVMDQCEAALEKRRLRCLHVNDSQTPLGSNRDRHAPLGEGELGARGCGAFLSEPRFEGLPGRFEGPGVEGKAPGVADMERARELRRNGLRARRRRGG
ncbi:MAG: deoxyribonuclease IV [Thermoleophilaceae bacterium]